MNKKSIFFLLMLLCVIKMQSQNVDSSNFSEEYVKFTNDQKQFNDWSVSIYGGVPWLQSSDFTSIENGMSGSWRVGYDFQASINKQISHVFALSLLGQLGETKQGVGNHKIDAKTNYFAFSLLGDLNVSSLLRRIDNRSPYRWAAHTYAGVGTIQYKAYRKDMTKGETEYAKIDDVKMGVGSFFAQAGVGLTYKINKRWDALFRVMYVVTGDKQFDGSGTSGPYTQLHTGGNSDNFITTSFGITYKIGKHNEYLGWVDPLRELYTKVSTINTTVVAPLEVCVSGDNDDDGVCDDWDRELDTPRGARVDGAGRALDVDMDGIIDLYDKCPTFPGKPNYENPELHGCPEVKDVANEINETVASMGGIQFNLDSDKILLESQPILDNVADVIKKYGKNTKFLVEGHTDSRGTDAYNLSLSDRRVASVIKYLESKGVSIGQLKGIGMGYSDPKYPECKPADKCPEWKNRANRRVIFKLID